MNDEFGLNALAEHYDAYMAELDAADAADEIANRMFNSDEERERLELEDYSK